MLRKRPRSWTFRSVLCADEPLRKRNSSRKLRVVCHPFLWDTGLYDTHLTSRINSSFHYQDFCIFSIYYFSFHSVDLQMLTSIICTRSTYNSPSQRFPDSTEDKKEKKTVILVSEKSSEERSKSSSFRSYDFHSQSISYLSFVNRNKPLTVLWEAYLWLFATESSLW